MKTQVQYRYLQNRLKYTNEVFIVLYFPPLVADKGSPAKQAHSLTVLIQQKLFIISATNMQLFCFCFVVVLLTATLLFRLPLQVQTDPCISTESFLVEMRDLDRRLEEMERQGVELERNLRGCKEGRWPRSSRRLTFDPRGRFETIPRLVFPDKEEERLLLEWFGLHHARHRLVRRDAELCHL